jgi:LacI family transcriptional regulator
MARRVDGIIVAPCGTDPAIFEEINKKHVPVILVDRFYEGSDLPYVTTNNYSGGVEAVNSLIRNGHRNIACIQGVKTSAPNKKRIAGYKAAMTDAGLEDNILVVGNEFSLQNGYLETKLLLNRSPRPTAMFTLSNTIALGAIKAIREAGMKIPEDISLIAFDNNIYMDFLTPPISRISQPVEDMAKLAVKLLFESIESHNRVNTKLELAPDFISRESVKKLEHKS